MKNDIKWWQVALATIVVSVLGALSTGVGKQRERKVYENKFRQAPWAPPASLFGPAWTINNYFLLQALKYLFQTESVTDKNKLVIKQVAIWLLFFTFGYVYFKKKSPVLAALWTLADAWLAASSFTQALKTNNKFAANYLPLLGWAGYAGSVGIYQALKNDDPFLKTPALTQIVKTNSLS
jgi:tryptophan-rich sensory protein